jgi:hypothetical protein
MITVTTTSPGETREMASLLRAAPAWLDWRIYHMGSLVVSSADARNRAEVAADGDCAPPP